MKKLNHITAFLFIALSIFTIAQGCASSKAIIANKSGAQLWGENCIRCHNTPTPVDFNDDEWKTIGLHMQDRATLTKDETDKIIEFLCSAN